MRNLGRPGTLAMLAALALCGCNTDQVGVGNLIGTQTPAPKPQKPPEPPVNMAGRWMLSSPGAGQCGMTFTTRGNGFGGAIAPGGGCPGEFFTSRHWALDNGVLVITNHKDKMLARLANSTTPGGFQGEAVSGLPVTLTR